MVVKVLGSGCPSCKKLLANTEKAVKKSGVDAEVVYVTDMQEIIKTGIMITPGLMIDGEIKVKGRVPNTREIMELIKEG
jgi:small redox-active disulfide protein 2